MRKDDTVTVEHKVFDPARPGRLGHIRIPRPRWEAREGRVLRVTRGTVTVRVGRFTVTFDRNTGIAFDVYDSWRMRATPPAKRCRCRKPRAHRDCAYCGFGGPATHVCGRCKEAGIDGRVIPGTSRVVCSEHKTK